MTPEQLRKAYMAHMKKEPPMDAGQHPSLKLHEEVGNEWARWERTRSALWTMLGDALAVEFIVQNEVAA